MSYLTIEESTLRLGSVVIIRETELPFLGISRIPKARDNLPTKSSRIWHGLREPPHAFSVASFCVATLIIVTP